MAEPQVSVGAGAARCVHRWLLDPPVGELIRAVCRNCGQRRNYYDQPVPKAEFNRLARARRPQ